MAKERTPEEKAARKEASRAKRQVKRQALKDILGFVRSRKNVPDEIQLAVRILTPGPRVGGGGPSKLDVFSELFTEQSTVSEMEIFEKFKAGRKEMNGIIKNLIRKRNPEDRVWVRLNADAEEYVVEGFGPNAPANWTGYRPVEVEDTEIL
jgi:hypothetical protein